MRDFISRRWAWLAGGVVLVLIVGVLCARARVAAVFANAPGWFKSYQPPDGIVTPVEGVPAGFNGCMIPSPMIASCNGYGAGRRVRKTYASNLAEEPSSLIRGNVSFGIGD